MHDIVIRNGTVIDGTGKPSFTADVAIDGDRIAAVGRAGRGRRELDATGLLVTPGFVDMHTHYDAQVTWDPHLTPSSWHGCTTVVMGNCGVGFAPARPDKHRWLIALMEGVEDIPGTAMHEGIRWEWETFPEYLDALERSPHAIDFGTQIPHGALRAYVMGERGAANEAATSDDIEAMRGLVREAIEAGALGFSTSRTLLHKSIYGEPVPGTFATREELFGIGSALRDAGRGVFQLAAEHLRVPEEFEWMKALSQEIGRPVLFNLSQTDHAPALWKDLVEMLDDAAASGVEVYGQVAGRSIGIVMSFELTAHPFAAHPQLLGLRRLAQPERAARLRDPEVRRRILDDTPLPLGEFETFVTRSFDKMYPLGAGGIDYEPDRDGSVAAIAAREGRPPLEVAYDLMLEPDGLGMLYFPLFNYADGNLDLLHTLHRHPRTRMGLSDAGAHCGAICDGGMPTFMLTHWTRDRTRGPKLPIEHVIRRQTSETAHVYGLRDRGVLEPGLKADVNVIDYDNLRFHQPEVAYDLPAGGRRLLQRADGYVATICGGAFIRENGEDTGALPGRLVRGPRSAS
jgi:N-acyl-D-aspartate/D-glutamate deacylase